jgi:hypothetical protein
MVTYGSQVDPEKLGDSLLIEPEGLRFVENLDSDSPLLGLVQNEFPFVGFFGISHVVLLHGLAPAIAKPTIAAGQIHCPLYSGLAHAARGGVHGIAGDRPRSLRNAGWAVE